MNVQFQQFPVEFTRDGMLFDERQAAVLLEALPGLTDLLVLSHGWNNDMADAAALYDRLCASLVQVAAEDDLVPKGLQDRRFGVLRVFWPSKRFTDEELIPGGGAADATPANDMALERLLQALKQNPQRLGTTGTDPVRAHALDTALALASKLELQGVEGVAARRDFVLQLRTILNPSAAHPDDGSLEFFVRDPEELFTEMAGAVPVPPGAAGRVGGATSMDAAGSAAGLNDLLSGMKAAARRLINFTTYYEMKQRAGTVGSIGLAPLLRRIRERQPGLRLHLAGHSFGGRLVTAAAHALPDRTPAVTMTLLQAAYSHNGLAGHYDGQHDGAFREVLSQRRASGPIVITHTKDDRAVGIAYPLASRIARQQTSALGTADDPYGGMGRNGAQHLSEDEASQETMHQVGDSYTFTPGRVFNLNADGFIKDHGDVTGLQVAYAVWNAVSTIS
ncbi:alpha/beta fold hydrolase [Azohydromonas australica]|uniref:alpha/beta fold hydrolase n=1 Tax=Azohydromonas australica TaxID=364039 RepID=UPI0003FCBEC8|nr:hypothetical protein [Azohydromonas australica]